MMHKITPVEDGFGYSVGYAEIVDHLTARGIAFPKQKLEPDWSCTIGDVKYTEMWLRYYVQGRHLWKCTVCCSQWANAATGEDQELIRDVKLDLEILLAHARVQQLTKEKVLKREEVKV